MADTLRSVVQGRTVNIYTNDGQYNKPGVHIVLPETVSKTMGVCNCVRMSGCCRACGCMRLAEQAAHIGVRRMYSAWRLELYLCIRMHTDNKYKCARMYSAWQAYSRVFIYLQTASCVHTCIGTHACSLYIYTLPALTCEHCFKAPACATHS